MKAILIWITMFLMTLSMSSCGQDGAAIAPGSGSTIQAVKADCNGEPCI